MTRQRNLGPVLALTAAGVALAAVIAGFIIVGGPGNARDRRLDDLTSQRISQIVGVVQCAFDVTGIAPIDYPSAASTRMPATGPGQQPMSCDLGGGLQVHVSQGDTPTNAGDITFQDIAPAQVKICGKFYTKSPSDLSPDMYSLNGAYPTLSDPHEAGVHCYVLDLIKSNTLPQAWHPPPTEPPAKPVP